LGIHRPGAHIRVECEGEEDEKLSQTKRGHDTHDPRSLSKSPHNTELGQGSHAAGDHQCDRKSNPVRDMPSRRGDAEERRTERAQLAVLEVDDLVRPEYQNETDREKSVGRADDGSEQQDGEWRLPMVCGRRRVQELEETVGEYEPGRGCD
jgi:hypothetical protein